MLLATDTSTDAVVAALSEALPDVHVEVNPGKARRGTFALYVRGKPVFELVGLKRPFKDLRETDLDDVAQAVVTTYTSESGEAKDEAKDDEAGVAAAAAAAPPGSSTTTASADTGPTKRARRARK